MNDDVKAHAKLSASGSERWLRCPGSVKLSESVPTPPDSVYAQEGTKAHTLFEKWLIHLRDKKGPFEAPKGFSRSMVDAVRVSIMAVEKIWASGEAGILETEKRVSLSFIDPDMFGTLDLRIVEHFGVLWVLDYKHGAGIPVDVRDPNSTTSFNQNSQLVYYALASAYEFNWDFEKVMIGILQPRALHAEGPFRAAEMSISHLKLWEDIFRRGVKRTKDPNPKFLAGKHCKWCPAKPVCAEYRKVSDSGAAMAFAGISP